MILQFFTKPINPVPEPKPLPDFPEWYDEEDEEFC